MNVSAVLLAIVALALFLGTLDSVLLRPGRLAKLLFPAGEKIPVPWSWMDAGLILFLFFLMPGTLLTVYELIPEAKRPAILRFERSEFPAEWVRPLEAVDSYREQAERSPAAEASDPNEAPSESSEQIQGAFSDLKQLENEHPLTKLLMMARQSHRFGLIALVIFFAGVVAAPIAEEFVFRRVLLGSVEKSLAGSAQVKAAGAIFVSSAAFAAVHWRTASPVGWTDLSRLLTSTFFTPIALLLTLILSVLWLRKVCHADAKALGWDRKRAAADFLRGVGVFVIFCPQMICMQLALARLFPNAVTDPIPIFFLAVYLGLLVHKTGRLAPAVGMHAALNLFSFVMILIRCKG